ncbi:oligosaccharide flippase family protein [Jannaschia pohangensis]|uniref:Membrane protein involved in the export of O-antigen and teichoic acid n=1 Tax=Jannaschia pohangensis TaxID=390807 RepID=A0A1I3QRR8_9RHOB|nr:oligosaccharide flippase family protein [Jannaschia pohangensis]SFJ36953.1 Membrane protein involved in the export of O-antigen and teichoic acid [Jannaschia pohangensis]
MNDTDGHRAGGSRMKRSGMAAFAFLSRSLQQISTFVITLLAARFLAPADYGVYALGVVFVLLIQTLTYTGFYQFVINSRADDRSVLSVSFWLICGLATAAALVLVVLAVPISWIFDAPELAPVLILLALAQPVAGAVAWASAVLLRRQRIERHFVIMFVQNLTALVGGVILLWAWQSLYALVAFRYLRIVSGLLLFAVLTRDRPAMTFDRTLAREAAGFSGGLYGARLMSFLSRYAGDLLLGAIYTTAEAGLYRFGTRIAGGAVDVMGQPLRSFALTQFGAGGRAQHDLAPILARFTGTTAFLTGGTAAVLIVFAGPMIETLFDPAYLAAVAVTYAMATRAVVNSALMIEPVFSALGRTSVVMVFNLVWAVITVASVFVAAQFGLETLAWSQAAIGVGMIASGLVVIRRIGGVAIGRAVRTLMVATALVLVYGLVLNWSWPYVAEALADGPGARLTVGLIWSLVLAAPTTVIAARSGVFTLRVFSG